LPVPVQSATTAAGQQCAVGQPDNNPNEVECPGNQAPTGQATVVTKQPMPCAGSIQHKVSRDNATYVAQQDIIANNNCGQGGGNQPKPCACASVGAFLNKFHIFGAGSTRIEFNVNWTLTCTTGTGTCKGVVKVLSPRGASFIQPTRGTIVTVNCNG